MRTLLTILLAAAAFQDAAPAPAAPEREPLVAFRFDSQRVVATVKSDLTIGMPQLARDHVPQPIAKYGYPVFDLPPDLQRLVPPAIRTGDRWTVHTGPGQVFGATAERIVLGEGGCSHLIGVLLKVDDRDAEAFAGVRAKYYAAHADPRDAGGGASELGELPASTLTPDVRTVIDRTLGRLLPRELRPGATLAYDAQPYRLTPDGIPSIFVRALWRAGGRQVFAAAVWLRADTGEVLWSNRRVASWIAAGEFRRGLVTENLGIILNVVDGNGDGWAEIVYAQLGYESVGVTLLDVRASFAPIGRGYSYGC